MDPTGVTEGAIAGVAAFAIEDALKPDTTLKVLEEIRDNLEVLIGIMHNPDASDIFKIVTLYKQGFGSNYIPYREDREFARILTASQLPLNITTPFGNFVFTVQAGIWTSIDFPGGTSYLLDTTATPNSQNVYVRFTNRPPQN